jgi:FAD/FMN-containing dehydrogenase
MPVPAAAQAAHTAGVERLLASYRSIPPTASVRLAKRNSNLFRARVERDAPGLDTSGLTDVIWVDPEARTADVAGMCTYEDLVAATLPYGLSPLVVPQLKTITLGGAVTGLGIESASFRNGLPHESVHEMDILTGAGELLTVSPKQHTDLYRTFPNSYGTLGYSTRLRIELEPVTPFVALRHVRFHSLIELVAAMDRIIDTNGFDGVPVDYLDGVVFSADESYLCVGVRTTTPGPVSDYTGRDIYYRSVQHGAGVKEDRLTIHDYFWRWDTDWFWCSRSFGAQNPKVRRWWPRRYRRSSVYWQLVALDQRFGIADRIEKRKGRPPRERVVQDIEVPIERTGEFLEWFLDTVPITPIWLCPLRLRDRHGWPLYPIRPDHTYVNIGFWSSVPIGATEGATNRLIEAKVGALDGHKSLYSDSYYTR